VSSGSKPRRLERHHEIQAFAGALRPSKATHTSCLILSRPGFLHLLHPVTRFLEARQGEARPLQFALSELEKERGATSRWASRNGGAALPPCPDTRYREEDQRRLSRSRTLDPLVNCESTSMDHGETLRPSELALRAIARVSRSPEARGMPRPERALWSFGRRNLSPGALEEIRGLTSHLDEAQWRQLLALARFHGMAPLVFWQLATDDLLSAIPAPIAAACKDEYLQTLINNRRMQTIFQEVVSALGAEGIRVMALKGLALARRYYGEVALRPMTDMDLLVRREDVLRATATLRRLGYRADNGMGSPFGFYSFTSAVVAYARPGSLSIEMHWELFGRHAYRPSLPAAEVWNRALVINIFDQSVRYLHPRDELWYLCVHAAIEHRLERLIWLVDIAELVDSLPADWDWQRFIEETRAAGVALPVAAALAYCCAHLRLSAPADALERLYETADTPAEQATCAAAQADLLSGEWIQMAAAPVRRATERAIFLRGVLAPHRSTLGALYGHDAARWHALPYTYLRHWRRTARPTLRALRGAGPSAH
jgi:hypothetical protein